MITYDDIHKRAAVRTGKYRGKQYLRFVVTAESGENAHLTLATEPLQSVTVLARNGREALAYVRREVYPHVPCLTLRTIGPKGGEYSEFYGWESTIGNAMRGAFVDYTRRLC